VTDPGRALIAGADVTLGNPSTGQFGKRRPTRPASTRFGRHGGHLHGGGRAAVRKGRGGRRRGGATMNLARSIFRQLRITER